jgi:hypothetical protein
MTTATRDRKPPTTPLPTDPDRVPSRRLRRDRAVRRVAIAALAVFVLAGLVGVFGYRTGSLTASGGGYELRLSYPLVGRPGVPVQWILHVHRDGGLPSKLTIGTSIGYFDLLEMNSIEPEPSGMTSVSGRVLWTFDTPGGEDMTILVDAYVSPNARRGASATTAILEDGAQAVSLSFRTRVAP